MYSQIITLLNQLATNNFDQLNVISWGAPIPSFGNPYKSTIATLGINPSNREFLNNLGDELKGKNRRFHTLNSLSLNSWLEADSRHSNLIFESCENYFHENPYDTWFRVLDSLLTDLDTSYYNKTNQACHLDLIPYATKEKWNNVRKEQKNALFSLSENTFITLLIESNIKILILNGKSVIESFQNISQTKLNQKKMPSWDLPRKSTKNVVGIGYDKVIDTISGIPIGRDILILGFNHNLQSSFGVTNRVKKEIRYWVKNKAIQIL